ncbi:hypothetical protein [Nannocystis radixulma]|uniref:Uncharacterized protein n=1 Tax=Nannocystis radixulma TaxID=2995305 RepID=A0ABT5B585_9BACT|nr:hypothetical protein [Nannocystis radixulma]MDC0669289.1 hypothetical protein [Nannocystis radixulma]
MLSLFQRLESLYEGTQNGFAGLTNRVVEAAGILRALTDNGFSTALGPPTFMNIGSAGSLGYILIDDIDEASYIGVVKANYGAGLQGFYLFRSGTITIGPDGKAIPIPILGQNIVGASPSAIIAAWREAAGSDHRAQLLMVIAPS